MNIEIVNIIILGTCFLILFASAELCYHKWHWQGEHSRKLVHIGTGLLTMFFPILLHNFWSVVFLCASFLVILIASLKFNLLKSINDIDRKSYGSVLYPIIVCLIFGLYLSISNENALCFKNRMKHNYFYLPILIMALCDPIATLVGKCWPYGKINLGSETKTLSGATGFVLMAFLLCIIFVPFSIMLQQGVAFWCTCILISIGACMAELFTKKGIDNFAIPLTVFVLLYLCEYKFFG